jgi:hypothetical protein
MQQSAYKAKGGFRMSRWTGIAIVGIWIGIGIMTFNAGIIPVIKDIAGYGAIVSLIIGILDLSC